MNRHDVSDTAHNVALVILLTLGTVWVCFTFYTLAQISSI
jgi:hypothetical protein